MRAANLARAAAEAEGLRLQRLIRRQITRVVYALVAFVFLIAALAVAHVLAVMGLRVYVDELYAILIVLGVDVLMLLVFGLLAAVSRPGSVERQALEIRQTAVAQLGANVSSWMVLRPVLRMLPGRHLYSLVLAGLTARHLSRR